MARRLKPAGDGRAAIAAADAPSPAAMLEQRAATMESEITNLPVSEQEAARASATRVLARRRPHQWAKKDKDGETIPAAEFGSPNASALRQMDTFGTSSPDFVLLMLRHLTKASEIQGFTDLGIDEINGAMAAVEAARPENEIEAMLAVQMYATHVAAMRMLGRAMKSDNSDTTVGYGSLATKLLRTYTTQVEALAKMRRGGEQKVTVEHVHVYPGGQAIVGNVSTAGGGAQLEKGQQPHALTGPAAIALPFDAPVLREDEGGHAMPVASRERQGSVPDARRRPRKRSAAG